MAIQNSFPKDEKQVVDSALSTTSTNPVRNAIITSNINSINSTLSSKANTSDVLTKTNTTAFTPTANYHPATKAYVDSKAGGDSNRKLILSVASQDIDNDSPLQIIASMDGTKSYEIEFDCLRGDGTYYTLPEILFKGTFDTLTAIGQQILQYASIDTLTQNVETIHTSYNSIRIGDLFSSPYGLVHVSLNFYAFNYAYGSDAHKGYGIKGFAMSLWDLDTTNQEEYMGKIESVEEKSYTTNPTFSATVSIMSDNSSYSNYTTTIKNLRVYEIS